MERFTTDKRDDFAKFLSRGSEHDYYAIADRLPRETRDYVPLMIAAARIAKEPQKYGFDITEGDRS